MVSRETFLKKQYFTDEFIAGVISVAGSFTHTHTAKQEQFGFQIKLPIQNIGLLDAIRKRLGLKIPVRTYHAKDSKYALLIARSQNELQQIIIPFCNEHLLGYKLHQFTVWRDKINEKNK